MEFRAARRQHSAVESSINALENHGLDRCPDHGPDGFKRYVGLAVVARNIQISGHAVQHKKLKMQQRLEKKQHLEQRKKKPKKKLHPAEIKQFCQLSIAS